MKRDFHGSPRQQRCKCAGTKCVVTDIGCCWQDQEQLVNRVTKRELLDLPEFQHSNTRPSSWNFAPHSRKNHHRKVLKQKTTWGWKHQNKRKKTAIPQVQYFHILPFSTIAYHPPSSLNGWPLKKNGLLTSWILRPPWAILGLFRPRDLTQILGLGGIGFPRGWSSTQFRRGLCTPYRDSLFFQVG